MSYFSHFYKADGFPYWRGVAKATVSIGKNDNQYGLGTQTNAGNLADTEAWAHYIGFYLTDRVLNSNFYGFELESRFSPRLTPDISGINWIPYRLLHDLNDNTPNERITLFTGNGFPTTVTELDNITGITPSMIYQQLTSEIKTIPQLKNKLAVTYPLYNNNSLSLLFKVYGY